MREAVRATGAGAIAMLSQIGTALGMLFVLAETFSAIERPWRNTFSSGTVLMGWVIGVAMARRLYRADTSLSPVQRRRAEEVWADAATAGLIGAIGIR